MAVCLFVYVYIYLYVEGWFKEVSFSTSPHLEYVWKPDLVGAFVKGLVLVGAGLGKAQKSERNREWAEQNREQKLRPGVCAKD